MDKLQLIKRNTQEIITEEELKEVLKKKTPVAYWGTAPTGQIHTGYLIAVQKMLDFISAGFELKVLIADIHAYLDDMKTPWELLEKRAEYYKAALQSLGLKKVKYVFDSELKYEKDYVKNAYRLSAMVTQQRALRAASEVCRLKNPKVSELLYPILQTLDCWKLEADVAYSGLDQRHIYALARESLPKLGFKAPDIVMTPILSSLLGAGKASASTPESNIKINENPKDLKEKIMKAFCPPKTEGNPVLEHYKFIIFPRYSKVKIKRDKKFGGDVEFKSYEDLEKAFLENKIHAADLKNDLAEKLIEILEPCRKYFEKNKDVIKEAYG